MDNNPRIKGKPPATALTAPGFGRTGLEFDMGNTTQLHDQQPDCCWPECREAQISSDLPLCQVHAWQAYMRFRDILDAHDAPPPPEPKPPLVYYLMLSPNTVKIGTTTNLPRRVTSLRTDMAYVVAVEPGGLDIEAERHRQFARDRIGRREDFRLSEPLRTHIEHLRENVNAEDLMDVHRNVTR